MNPRERHWTVIELATVFNLSQDTVRRLFRDEPGVFKIFHRRRGTRIHVTLRIPESVAQRVYQSMTRGGR